MANIFVSYNRESEVITKGLVDDIKLLGHTVWFDQELNGGQAWWDQILETIRNSDVFVFVLNPESLNSQACKLEYNYAADLDKIILPVLISGDLSTNLLPPALSKIQFVDYQKRDRDAALYLAKAFTKIPPGQPLPSPLPVPPEAPISHLGSLTVQVDTKTNLSYEEQSVLLVNLKRSFHNPETTDDTRMLLERVRNRHDLVATIAEEIDELLRNTVKIPVASPHSSKIEQFFAIMDFPHPSKTEHFFAIIDRVSKSDLYNKAPALLWFSIAAYMIFTLPLFATPWTEGLSLMFMGNSLILVLGSVISFFSRIRASKICGIGAFVQIAILIGHFIFVSEELIIVILNLGITGAFLGMMAFYAKKERKQP